MKESKYFNVFSPVEIAGKKYIPAVGYPVTLVLDKTIEKLAAEGRAEIYDYMPVFENGAEKKAVKPTKKPAPKKTGAKK